MTRIARSLPFALAALALGSFGAVSAAHARTDVHVSLGVPGVYVQPRPVYVQPQPVYVQSQPAYVYTQPGYVYQGPAYGHGYRDHGHARRHGPRGDLDRDGIPNRYDRDRDGDGVPNWHDRQPDNGWRR